jgi:very-short-patch-repair endonuclease
MSRQPGFHFSVETKQKISAVLKGRVLSAEHRANLSVAHTGRKLSTETRARMSVSARRRLENTSMPLVRQCNTWPELALAWMFDQGGTFYEKQKRFGRCVVDFWLPDEQLVFEADGDFWHQDKEKEARRDEYLMERGVLAVIHLGTQDLLFANKERKRCR